MASTGSISLNDSTSSRCQKLAANNKLPKATKKHLSFAFGEIYENYRDYGKSFHYFSEGNRLQQEDLVMM